ncbi:uncharacterized protein involved in exopolysaccharide biosynthesis/Mrp family chromosome partitioning ATPase [Altererythrobacter atlanticus]|nr:uncharacterized protein involved in exopolysaccharide biosynthesis/Mrp family chromosome partitioning ATPase [Croceibacterium atlanticum]
MADADFSKFDYDATESGPDEVSGRGGGGGTHEVRNVLRALRRNRWLIVSIVAVAVVLAAISQLLATPMYKSVATVQVELTDEEGTNQAEAEARNAIRVQNEAKIYRSRAVAAKVVEDLDLINNRQFMGSNFVRDGELSEQEHAAAVTKLTRMISVVNAPQSDLLDIEVTSPYPDLAADIANQYPLSAQEMRVSRRQRMRRRMLTDLEQESTRLAAKLAAAEKKVAEFRAESGMLEGAGGSEDLAQINRVAVEAASAQALKSASSARSSGVSRAAGMTSTANADSPLLQQQRRRRAELETERTRLSSTFGAGHPQMVSLSNQISELDQSIRREEAAVQAAARQQAAAEAAQQRTLAESERDAAAARANELRGMLNEMTAKAYSNNANKAQLAQLEREAEVARSAYMSTVNSEEEVRSALGIIGVNSTLISGAVPQSEPFYPKPARTIAGALLAALVISLLIVFARELLDDKLRSPSQIFRMFGLKTFGMFPALDRSETTDMTLENNPVVNEPHSVFAEVARGLHTHILDLAKPNKTQTVFVTSPLPSDGKATVAISLCAAAAAAGQRAIVVDFDLRQPSIIQDIQRELGRPDLVDLLTEPGERIRLPAPQKPTDSRELTTYSPVVVSMREPVKNPAAVFTPDNMRNLFGRLNEDFDLVVINGPSALAVHDVRSLARFADNILLVMRWGQTTVPQIEATLDKLANRVDGAVFDGVDYADHARRGYQDEVQYYMQSTSEFAHSGGFAAEIRNQLAGFANGFKKIWARG